MCIVLGPFSQTPDLINAVDFTNQVADSFFSVVLPVQHNSKMWFIIDPLDYEVWLCLIISIPVYFLSMWLSDYLYNGYAKLDVITGFILRNVLSEQNCMPTKHTKIYQKLFIIVWLWSMMVLVCSYAGNLTAMLARPKLQDPIRTFEELMNQDDVPWVIEEGPVGFYMASSASGSVLRRLYEHATIMPPLTAVERMSHGCYTAGIKEKGKYGSICASGNIMALMFNDFTKTGKCNYYITEDKLLQSGASMAFQVLHTKVQIIEHI